MAHSIQWLYYWSHMHVYYWSLTIWYHSHECQTLSIETTMHHKRLSLYDHVILIDLWCALTNFKGAPAPVAPMLPTPLIDTVLGNLYLQYLNIYDIMSTKKFIETSSNCIKQYSYGSQRSLCRYLCSTQTSFLR